ncbi:Serine/threonine-protein phosphatase 6 regulatory ankyrin repeat subunit A [Thelohanellus kitauei]|uniref:Serine/threonine-protein phosphatase 6 regulatory ankyrin repeat subunit A n=1 Tax=Thelohanellus kitauei TaxID=669202 RepID=A0A0C2J120_THEKT|nr:Serine/threonine-protein phosphatase 6 regulatory ankyrin repeat subunit A [Thelohanellus kitauei]
MEKEQILLSQLSTIHLIQNNSKYLIISIIRQVDEPIRLIDFCLKHGADVNFSDPSGWTALHEAVKLNDFKLVKYLLKFGADANKPCPTSIVDPREYYTPFEFACILSDECIVREMIGYGADVTKKIDNKFFAITLTISPIVKELIRG